MTVIHGYTLQSQLPADTLSGLVLPRTAFANVTETQSTSEILNG